MHIELARWQFIQPTRKAFDLLQVNTPPTGRRMLAEEGVVSAYAKDAIPTDLAQLWKQNYEQCEFPPALFPNPILVLVTLALASFIAAPARP